MSTIGHGIVAFALAPTLPVWLLIALAVLGLGVISPAILRRAHGWGWRFAALTVLVLWLAGPRLVRETWHDLPDIGLLLVDQSRSMQIDGRSVAAAEAAARLRQEAARFHHLTLDVVPVPESHGEGTQMFAALHRALATIPRDQLAGVIAVTDGEISDVPKAGTDPSEGAPFSAVIPARGEQRDRSVRLLVAPKYGIVGKEVTLEAEVNDYGVAHPARSVSLAIRTNGSEPRIESVPIDRPVKIAIPITRAGPSVVELTAAKLPGEVSTINNSAVVTINGVRNRLHVLLVSGYPDPGVRAWRLLLKSDPAVDLVHFTILRPPYKDDGTPLNQLALIAFPAHELFVEKLDHFDLIIFDQFQNDGLLPPEYLQNIADYVRGGGALLVEVGPEFAGPDSIADSPLASVLPATPIAGSGGVAIGSFRPLLTAIGGRHPVTDDLPGWRANGDPTWGPWYRFDRTASAHGEILMKTPSGSPLLVLNRVGKGRVAMLLSDQIWLWARDYDGGGPEAELMRRVAHWLMKEPDLEENALISRVVGAKVLVERRTLAASAAGEATVVAPDGKKSTVALTQTRPGRAQGSFNADAPGVWSVRDGPESTFVAAGTEDPLELADLAATARKLDPVIHASGGGVYWLGSGGVPELRRVEPGEDAGGRGWIGLRRNHAHEVSGVSETPLLPAWAALPLLLGLVVVAWQQEGARERREGDPSEGSPKKEG